MYIFDYNNKKGEILSDFLVKHKIFVVLVVALLTLLVGGFVINSGRDNAEGAYRNTIQASIDCYWYNYVNTGHSSGYVSQSGDSFGSVGNISLSFIEGVDYLSSVNDYLSMDTTDSIPNQHSYTANQSYQFSQALGVYEITATPIDGFMVAFGNSVKASNTAPSISSPALSACQGWYAGVDWTGENAVGLSSQLYTLGNGNLTYRYTSYRFCAYFAPQSYTLTYSGGYGAWADTSSATTKIPFYERLPSVNNPYLANYSFYGWYTSLTGGYLVNLGSDYYDWTYDKTIYARYYATVNLNGNGNGSNPSKTVYYGLKPSVSVPTRTGYVFRGYYTSATGGTKVFNTDGSVVASVSGYTDSSGNWTRSSGGATLYAHWTKDAFNVSIDCSATNLLPDYSFEHFRWTGGSLSASYVHSGTYSQYVSATASVPEVVLTATDSIYLDKTHIYYVCVYGYQTTKCGSVDCYWPIAEPGMGAIAAKTAKQWNLYSWRVVRSSFTSGNYQLRFDFNNNYVAGNIYFDSAKVYDLTAVFGAGKEPDKAWCDTYLPIMATYGNAMPSISAPTKTGYIFNGIYDAVTGGNQYYTSSGASAKAWDKGTKDVALYSRWTEATYIISFNQQSGSGGTTSLDVVLNTAVDNITVPTRTGYTFGGYYSSTGGGGTKFFNTDGTVVAGISGYTDSSGKWLYYGNITLYAKWTENTYNIAFNSNGGSGSMTTLTGKKYTESVTLSANAFTKTGYHFVCWEYKLLGVVISSHDNQAKVTGLTSVNGATVTLYAKWEANTYTIAYDANGGSGTMASQTATYDGDAVTLTTNSFTRESYLFKGWNTEAGGTGTSYKQGASVTNLTSENGATVTMYAVWEETWANKATQPSGEGTLTDPYLISSAENLAWISKQTLATSSFGGYFKQTANIDLIDMIWQPIGNSSHYFIGNYDGNGYAITGIQTAWYTDASDNFLYQLQGLFGYVFNGAIANLNVLGGTISGKEYVGGIVGYARNSTISNCQTNVTISASNYCGGIAGYGDSSRIQRCYSNAYITASTNTGGILGYSYSTNTEVNSCGFNGYLTFSKAMIMVGGGKAIIIDCFGISQGTNAFAPTDSASYISSSLYISGSRKYYYQRDSFSNWIIPTWVTNSTLDRTPIPKALSWIAGSGTAVSSYNDLTRLGYQKV